MALKKSEKRLLIILGVAVCYFVFDRLVLSNGNEEEPAVQIEQNNLNTSTVELAEVVSSSSLGMAGSGIQVEEFDDWGRNPFSLTGSDGNYSGTNSNGGPSRPTLKGIFWIKDKPFVLINHLILSEGEEAEGVRVESINDEEVLCYQGSQLFTLHWRESP